MDNADGGNGPLTQTVGEAAGGADLDRLMALLDGSGPGDQGDVNTPEAPDPNDALSNSQTDSEDPPTGEEPAQPDPEAEAETEDDAPEPEALPKHVQAKVDRRISKEVRKRKEAEEQLTSLRTELETLKAGQAEAETKSTDSVVVPADLDPVKTDPNVRQFTQQETDLTTRIQGARQMLRRLQSDPDGTMEMLIKGGAVAEHSADTEAVKDQLADLIDTMGADRANVAAKRGLAEERARETISGHTTRSRDLAKSLFPWQAQKDDPRHALAEQFLKSRPWMKKLDPMWPLLAAGAAELLHSSQQQQAKGKATAANVGASSKATVKPLHQPAARPSGAPANVDRNSANAAALKSRFENDPGGDASLDYLAQMLAKKK